MRSEHGVESIVDCRTSRDVSYCKKFQCSTKGAKPFVLPIGFLNARKLALGWPRNFRKKIKKKYYRK